MAQRLAERCLYEAAQRLAATAATANAAALRRPLRQLCCTVLEALALRKGAAEGRSRSRSPWQESV